MDAATEQITKTPVHPKPIVLRIDLATLWEEARSHALTSDNWPATFEALRQLHRTEEPDGRTPVYMMCMVGQLHLDRNLRDMTDAEVEKDEPCPFYEEGQQDELHAFLRSLSDNYDCDTGANGTHPTNCRTCRAAELLRLSSVTP